MKKVDFLFQGVNESGEWDVYLIKIKTNKKTHCSTPSLRQLILLKSQSLNIAYKLLGFLRLKLPTKVQNCGPWFPMLLLFITGEYFSSTLLIFFPVYKSTWFTKTRVLFGLSSPEFNKSAIFSTFAFLGQVVAMTISEETGKSYPIIRKELGQTLVSCSSRQKNLKIRLEEVLK